MQIRSEKEMKMLKNKKALEMPLPAGVSFNLQFTMTK